MAELSQIKNSSYSNECLNCLSWMENCQLLQEEVRILSNKIDSLTNYVLHETANKSIQCAPETLSIQKNVVFSDQAIQCHVETPITLVEKSTNTPAQTPPAESTVEIDVITDPLLEMFLDNTQETQLHNEQPFTICTDNYFVAMELNDSTDFDVLLNNRQLAYYGESPYHYGNIAHQPKPINSNVYLCKMFRSSEIIDA